MKRNTAIALAYWLTLAIVIFAAGKARVLDRRLHLALFVAYVFLLWSPSLIVKFIERRPIVSLGLQLGSLPRVILWGLGAFVMSLVIEIGYKVSFRGEGLLSATSLVPNWPFEILQQLFYMGFPEEIASRGYLFTRLCESWGAVSALFVSAMLFGMMHLILGDLATAIQAGLVGLVYGWAFLKTESVYAATLAHILINLFA